MLLSQLDGLFAGRLHCDVMSKMSPPPEASSNIATLPDAGKKRSALLTVYTVIEKAPVIMFNCTTPLVEPKMPVSLIAAIAVPSAV